MRWLLAISVVVLALFFYSTNSYGAGTLQGQRGQVTSTSTKTATVNIVAITASCSSGKMTGTISLSGPFTGSIILIVTSHKPGHSTWDQTGGTTTVSFNGQSSSQYSIPVNLVSGANAYRVEVKTANGISGGTTTKSASLECGTVSTSTVTATPVATQTKIVLTSTVTPVATATVVVSATAPSTATPTSTSTSVNTPVNTPTPTSQPSGGGNTPTPTGTTPPSPGGGGNTPTPTAISTLPTQIPGTAVPTSEVIQKATTSPVPTKPIPSLTVTRLPRTGGLPIRLAFLLGLGSVTLGLISKILYRR